MAHQTPLTTKQMKTRPLAAPNLTPSHLAKPAGPRKPWQVSASNLKVSPLGGLRESAHEAGMSMSFHEALTLS